MPWPPTTHHLLPGFTNSHQATLISFPRASRTSALKVAENLLVRLEDFGMGGGWVGARPQVVS